MLVYFSSVIYPLVNSTVPCVNIIALLFDLSRSRNRQVYMIVMNRLSLSSLSSLLRANYRVPLGTLTGAGDQLHSKRGVINLKGY